MDRVTLTRRGKRQRGTENLNASKNQKTLKVYPSGKKGVVLF
jgi:hypothetical protein